MAAKPSLLPDWATGGTNTTEPSAGLKISGWGLNAVAVSSYANWLAKITRDWLEYLKDGVMSGAFTFDSTVGITGATTITGSATVGGLVNTKSKRNSAILTPAAIGANQNDYAPTGHADNYHFRLSSASSYNITGLAGGVDGREVVISNVNAILSGNTFTLIHNSGSSSAANRFHLAIGANITITEGMSVRLIYDGTASLWRRVT